MLALKTHAKGLDLLRMRSAEFHGQAGGLRPRGGQRGFRMVHQRAVDPQRRQAQARHLKLKITQHPLPRGHQPAGAGLFVRRAAGDHPQRVVLELRPHAVSGELALILADEATLRVLHDLKHVVGAQRITNHAHRQAADELRLETVVDEVLCQNLAEQMLGGGRLHFSGDEADGFPVRAFLDDLVQPAESTADDEEDVPRIHHLAARAALTCIKHHLHLAADVVRRIERHLCLLHQLQQRRLHAAPAHVAAQLVRAAAELVDLIQINDAVLRQFDVAVRLRHQIAHQIVHIRTHVAGLAELGRVRLHKRHADEFRDVFDEVGLPHARRTNDDDVLFRKLQPRPR